MKIKSIFMKLLNFSRCYRSDGDCYAKKKGDKQEQFIVYLAFYDEMKLIKRNG